jgi:SAM-dependent methyltransferase
VRYEDLLGDEDRIGSHPGQRLMGSRALPRIYERLWRPLGARILLGLGPDTAEEHRLALDMLRITPTDRVLDVGCGPGNFTRDFARAAAEGEAIGIDASRTMLEAAVRQGGSDNLSYQRADARALPFEDASFDAVCCFAALYLIDEPLLAVSEIVRVLAPGGRVALLATCSRGALPARLGAPVVRALTGVRLFDRDELTTALAERGLVEVGQRVAGLGQFVSARKPGP